MDVGNFDLGDCGFQIGDVALNLGVPDIADGAIAYGGGGGGAVRDAESLSGKVLGVEFRKGCKVLPHAPGRQRIPRLFRCCRPLGEPGDPLVDIPGPVAGLAELAVADDVHAGLGLLPDHVGDAFAQAGLVRGFVIRTSLFDLLQEGDQLGRPDQAPDVRGQNSIRNVCHGFL